MVDTSFADKVRPSGMPIDKAYDRFLAEVRKLDPRMQAQIAKPALEHNAEADRLTIMGKEEVSGPDVRLLRNMAMKATGSDTMSAGLQQVFLTALLKSNGVDAEPFAQRARAMIADGIRVRYHEMDPKSDYEPEQIAKQIAEAAAKVISTELPRDTRTV